MSPQPWYGFKTVVSNQSFRIGESTGVRAIEKGTCLLIESFLDYLFGIFLDYNIWNSSTGTTC